MTDPAQLIGVQKLKKDNVILQGMYQRQSKELNDLRRAFSKQEHELKLLSEKQRMCKEKYITNGFNKQEAMEELEYAEIDVNDENGGHHGIKSEYKYSLAAVNEESEYAEVDVNDANGGHHGIKTEYKYSQWGVKEESENVEIGIKEECKSEPRVKEECGYYYMTNSFE